MKKTILMSGLAATIALSVTAKSNEETQKLDTIYLHYPETIDWHVTPRHDYGHTLTSKLFLCQSHFDDHFKHRDNGKSTVYMNCEQAVEALRAMDNITLGMPKIMYLVGWQYNGHDSKYPAFFEGNKAIMRACDSDPLESIRWVMREGKKYHTDVSVHINMFDAFEDSPLFQKYLENDVLARNKVGQLINGEWGFKVSYAQEWDKGFAQERLDSLCKILPLAESGTLHIDAYHLTIPEGYLDENGEPKVRFINDVVSPYLKWTRADEKAAQCNIITYLDQKGIDMTNEGPDGIDGPDDPFLGYHTMVFHYPTHYYFKYLPSQVWGGDNYSEWGRVFGNCTNVEPIFKENLHNYERLKAEFCNRSLICDYLSYFNRLYALEGENYHAVQYEKKLKAELKGNDLFITQNGCTLVEGNDILIPARWMEGKNLVAYSQDGYEEKTWRLTKDFPSSGKVTLYEVTAEGNKPMGKVSYSGRKLKLSLKPGQMLQVAFTR